MYRHDIESCFSDAAATGVDRDAFADATGRLPAALARLAALRDDGLPLLHLPGQTEDIAGLAEFAQAWRQRCRRVVVLGTGGSSLGARTLAALRRPGDWPVLAVPDNLDPDGADVLLDGAADPETGFLIVSKSGGTAETLAQALVVVQAIEAAHGNDAIAQRCLAIVEPGDSPLRRLAGRYGIGALDHDPRVGGRYSVLSLVGLLPALLVGLDAGAVRRGADAVLGAVLGDDGAGSAPAQGAALAAAAMADGRLGQSVLLSYADRLQPFGLWYRQLWAESLGKQGHGTTPVDALGPVDQHSQLQLYLDGPADKLFTVLTVTAAGRGPVVDAGLAGDLGLGYLAGRTIGDLTDAMARGTTDALVAAGRPVRRIAVDRLDEESLGALLMHFMLETVLAAFLIGVDPFDQPAVEDGKRRARAYLDAGAA